MLGRLLLAAASLLLALACAEGAFRAWTARERHEAESDDDWRARITAMNRTLYRRSEDPRLVYEPEPGARFSAGDWEAAFSPAAIRDDREVAPLPSGRRVVVLGDSVAWGEHLSLSQTLPRRMEAAMPGTEVLNLAVTGYDTEQELAWYERAGRRLSPTDVLVVYCLNDVLIMSGPYNAWADPGQAARKREQDELLDRLAPIRAETIEQVAQRRERDAAFTLLARVETLIRGFAWERSSAYTDEFLVMYEQPEAWARVEGSLVRLGSEIRADGARAWLAISPVLRDWERYRWTAIHERVEQAAASAGFEVIDPLPGWRAGRRPEDLRFYSDSLHYSAKGTDALARAIAGAME